MKKITILFSMITGVIMLNSCEGLLDDDADSSDDKVVEALKTALEVGTDTSTTVLSAVNGYYGDPMVKVPLPDEVEAIRTEIENLKKKSTNSLLGSYFSDVTDQLFEDVVIGVNKAAESAATEAAPIFSNSIQEMSITDALDILNGKNPASGKKTDAFDSTAATQYFKSTTKTALVDLYAPKIDYFLDKPLIKKKSGEAVSPNSAFNTLKTEYNTAYDFLMDAIDAEAASAGLFGLTPIADAYNQTNLKRIETESLGTFSTTKALDGLFLKVGDTEREIRRDPWKWVANAVGAAAEAIGELFVDVFGDKE